MRTGGHHTEQVHTLCEENTESFSVKQIFRTLTIILYKVNV